MTYRPAKHPEIARQMWREIEANERRSEEWTPMYDIGRWMAYVRAGIRILTQWVPRHNGKEAK